MTDGNASMARSYPVSEGLDPCPICHSRLVGCFERQEGLFIVSCENDDCHFTVEASGSSANEAVRQWNTRGVAQAEPITHRWRSFGALTWIYDPEPEWLEDHKFEVEWEPVYGAPQPVSVAQPPTDSDKLAYTSTGQIAACKCGSFPRLYGDGARPDDGYRSLWCQTCMEHVTSMMPSEREVIDHWNDLREQEHAALQTKSAETAPAIPSTVLSPAVPIQGPKQYGWPVSTRVCDCITGEVEPGACHCERASEGK